ncbi:hypothetical protein Q9L58_000096 [Maublancomyces gigas]|uniref:Very-long-chain (3R)-3-hydroxyacyl-CoA dehydratase n=1 Tax=Discina gigas TaxID=1032678 RepID=A0ABR3GXW4_9PEZI
MDRPQEKSSLIAYNAISCVLWLGVLGRTVLAFSSAGSENVYASVGEYTKWTQTLALLEIVHIVLGLLRSSLPTTIVQVSSRILLVWGITNLFEAPQVSLAYSSMLVAWSVTEVYRYSYYVTNIMGRTPRFLTWLRYNTFFVLYPMGAGSEAWCIYQSLAEAKVFNANYYWVLVAILVTYPPGLYKQYTHMVSQRRKNIRGKKRQT